MRFRIITCMCMIDACDHCTIINANAQVIARLSKFTGVRSDHRADTEPGAWTAWGIDASHGFKGRVSEAHVAAALLICNHYRYSTGLASHHQHACALHMLLCVHICIQHAAASNLRSLCKNVDHDIYQVPLAPTARALAALLIMVTVAGIRRMTTCVTSATADPSSRSTWHAHTHTNTCATRPRAQHSDRQMHAHSRARATTQSSAHLRMHLCVLPSSLRDRDLHIGMPSRAQTRHS